MPTSFALFKYPHGGRPLIGPVRRGVMYGGAVLALLATVLAFPVGAVLWLVPVVARLSAARYLQIGPRYLLCGDTIVYFGNVQRMVLARSEGRLSLYGADKGKPLVIVNHGSTRADEIADVRVDAGTSPTLVALASAL